MLARVDRINGVERSYTNRAGTLIRVSLTPDANADVVAESAAAVLSDGDPVATPVRLADAAEAIDQEEWRDRSRVRELSDIEWRTVRQRTIVGLVALAGLITAGVVWLRRRRRFRIRNVHSESGL